jgi:peptide-methionine (S)-S-oxide reductase
MKKTLQIATFAAGCFWGVEETFRRQKGVKSTVAGYAGGWTDKPTYKDVCSDETGHAESVQIKFDPKTISYGKLLELFWSIHDPTQSNRQGLNIGSQYRSVIFFHSRAQHAAAKKSFGEQEKKLGKKLATQIVPFTNFYRAEEYHQKYLMKKGLKVCH